MMRFDYYLSPEAECDIDEIVTYIANENTSSAYAFLDACFTFYFLHFHLN